MKYLILISLTLLSVTGHAQSQSGTDSLYFFKQTEKAYRFIYGNATQLNGSDILKAGFASLSYSQTEGHFRTAQEAEKSQIGKIYTEGINTLGKFKVAGYFSFSRTYQDSLAWSTKGTEIDAQTLYFGSVKAGEFERTSYQLGGTMSYELLKDKLFLGMGTDYSYQSSTRSVDPRPDVKNFRLLLKPELVFKFNNQLIGLQGNWGYGTEKLTLAYKNKQYNGNNGYPDRINYLIYGYGTIIPFSGSERTLRNQKYGGLELNYSGKSDQYRFGAKVAYNRWNDVSKDIVANSVNDNLIGNFVLNTISADLLIQKESKKTSQQLSLQASTSDGSDWTTRYSATNYYYHHQELAFEYLLRFKNRHKLSPELGLNLGYDRLQKKDILTAHDMEVTHIEPGISGNLYFSFPKKDLISFSSNVSYRLPISQSLTIPSTQEFVFTRGVVYGNYLYGTSEALKLSGKINYTSSAILKDFKTGISLQGIYLSQINSKFSFPTASFVPDGHRAQLNLAINLYF